MNIFGGTNLSKPIFFQCEPTTPIPGDVIDNDCDGRTDEERRNGVDDDGDGLVDEDLELVIKQICTFIEQKRSSACFILP